MKSARVIVAGVATAALALTGCTGHPGTAASVDGVTVSDAAVTRAGNAIAAAGADPTMAWKQASYDLALGEASRQIAASSNTVVTEKERADILASSPAAAAIANTPDGKEWGEAVTTSYLVIDKMGEEAYAQALRAKNITINPRYGTWSPEKLTLTDSSLAQPATPAQR